MKTIAYPLAAVSYDDKGPEAGKGYICDANGKSVTGWGKVINDIEVIEDIVARANSHEALKSVVAALIHNHKFGNVWPDWLPDKGICMRLVAGESE